MDTRGDGADGPAAGGGVQSIDRVVAILSVFSRARPVAGISEIARLTSLSRGTAHRLVAALTSHGLMAQVPDSTAYSLGPRLLTLGDIAREQLSLETQSVPVMTRLRDETGETVGLHVLDAEPSRRTIAQVESLQPLRRTYTDLGAPRPPHQGAPGKVLLAFAASPRLALARAQLADDSATLAALDEALDRVRADGYAISLEERIPGVVAVAMPVFDHTGAVAALSVSVPAVRAGRDELIALVPALRDAVEELSGRLGRPSTSRGVAGPGTGGTG